MPEYQTPKPVILTADESQIYERIPDRPPDDDWQKVADAMEALMHALGTRKAIPEPRLKIFGDPAYAESGKKSRMQVFESNGTSGNDIFRHPHFLPYLHYFVAGPRLPDDVMGGLCKILNEDMGTSGMVMGEYCRFARESVRRYQLDRTNAATEFFRLGVEIGMELHDARTLRRAAKSTR
ncbi:MAG: hypothetical protein AAFU85_29280 [Planctomycetota bacterium]